MGSYLMVQDGKLYYVEDGKAVVIEEHYRNEIERYGNQQLEELHDRYHAQSAERTTYQASAADEERWLMADMGVVPTNTGASWYRGSRPANHVILRGEAKESSTSAWLWLLAGAVLAGLLVWWW